MPHKRTHDLKWQVSRRPERAVHPLQCIRRFELFFQLHWNSLSCSNNYFHLLFSWGLITCKMVICTRLFSVRSRQWVTQVESQIPKHLIYLHSIKGNTKGYMKIEPTVPKCSTSTAARPMAGSKKAKKKQIQTWFFSAGTLTVAKMHSG